MAAFGTFPEPMSRIMNVPQSPASPSAQPAVLRAVQARAQSCETGPTGTGAESIATGMGAASDASGEGATGCGQLVNTSAAVKIAPLKMRIVGSPLGGELDVDDTERLGLIEVVRVRSVLPAAHCRDGVALSPLQAP